MSSNILVVQALMRRQHAQVRTATWVLFTLILPTYATLLSDLYPIVNFINDSVQLQKNEPPDQAPDTLSEYDFIIVGAGTAGCTLANRLTEVSGWNVLLVEAGMNEKFYMDIPLTANYLQFTDANWKYKTEPSQSYCTGFVNQQCNWPRGKVLGGSSVLNYMIYTRGAKQDYDNWEAMGNDGWGYDDVLPYFKKIENFNIPDLDNSEYHGYEGYLNVEHVPFRTEVSKAWISGAQELGFKNGDLNAADPAGVTFLQVSMKNGTRYSSNRAYLVPIHTRNNLYVSKGTLVTKLIFDDTKTKVIGVELEKNTKVYTILAKNEVIISAGAINSPQLLMLSGIGPQDDLKALNIPVVKDLKVGYNLMDHVAPGGLQWIVQHQNVSLTTPYLLTHLNVVLEWMASHQGPLSVPGGCEALVYMNLKDKFNTTAWPDIELLFIGAGLNADPTLQFNFNFDPIIYESTYAALGTQNTFMVFPMLMRPKSKGRIMLKSTDPTIHPALIPNYFEDSEDLDKIVEAIKVAIDISKQTSMLNIKTNLYDVPILKCLTQGSFGSDAYFACQARMFSFTFYHYAGTCKMGSADDSTAVVDNRLKVHGIDNLRVIDASIMPEIVSSHTNSPTYMIAEKGADMIKQDWGKL